MDETTLFEVEMRLRYQIGCNFFLNGSSVALQLSLT